MWLRSPTVNQAAVAGMQESIVGLGTSGYLGIVKLLIALRSCTTLQTCFSSLSTHVFFFIGNMGLLQGLEV